MVCTRYALNPSGRKAFATLWYSSSEEGIQNREGPDPDRCSRSLSEASIRRRDRPSCGKTEKAISSNALYTMSSTSPVRSKTSAIRRVKAPSLKWVGLRQEYSRAVL